MENNYQQINAIYLTKIAGACVVWRLVRLFLWGFLCALYVKQDVELVKIVIWNCQVYICT